VVEVKQLIHKVFFWGILVINTDLAFRRKEIPLDKETLSSFQSVVRGYILNEQIDNSFIMFSFSFPHKSK